MSTRPRRNMEIAIINLSGATAPEITLLADEGIVSGPDLGLVTYEDLTQALPGSSLMTRRKLALIGSYIAKGNTVTATITMSDIARDLATPTVVVPPVPPPMPPVPAGYPPDPDRGAMKLLCELAHGFQRSAHRIRRLGTYHHFDFGSNGVRKAPRYRTDRGKCGYGDTQQGTLLYVCKVLNEWLRPTLTSGTDYSRQWP